MEHKLFLTSVVGSMPRPQFVRDLLDPSRRKSLSESEFAKRMDAAVRYIIALQESAGLDVVSDGEWRRLSYIGVIAEVMSGFEVEMKDGRPWTTVVRKIRPKHPGIIAEEGKFLKENTDRMTKVCLPSPYLLGQRMWDEFRSKAAYSTRESFMEALVPVLRNELLGLRDVGVTMAQIDDPHLCLFVDEKIRKQYEDVAQEIELCVCLINQVVEGIDGIKIAIHLCRRNRGRLGWVGEGGYELIIPYLKKLKVDQYVLEFAIPVAGDVSVLKQLPEDKEIGLGCVDCRNEQIDSPDEIVARVQRAFKYISAERIYLNPDCGFAPGSAADIPIDEAYLKLKNEVEAARILRGQETGNGKQETEDKK